jgi:hypothetical protein
MARIFRKSDRIAVKIDDVTVKLSPLTIHQKVETTQAMYNGQANADLRELTRGTVLALKYSVKSVEGVYDSDGKPYQLQFEGDSLTEECVDDLMNLQITKKLALVCAGMLNGIPEEFTDISGNKIDGVELVSNQKEDSSKNV